MEPKISIRCSQDPGTQSCPEPEVHTAAAPFLSNTSNTDLLDYMFIDITIILPDAKSWILVVIHPNTRCHILDDNNLNSSSICCVRCNSSFITNFLIKSCDRLVFKWLCKGTLIALSLCISYYSYTSYCKPYEIVFTLYFCMYLKTKDSCFVSGISSRWSSE
jgi:hypothetical protein